jgi:hypothetical protein
MSTIVDFRLIDTSKLEELKSNSMPKKGLFGKVKDIYFEYLEKNTKQLEDYGWSGNVYLALLEYLEEKGIELMKSAYYEISEFISAARESTCFIFTKEHKLKYLEKLDPSNFDETELKDYCNSYFETDETDAGQAMLDAIKLLQTNLQKITEDSVIIFEIG